MMCGSAGPGEGIHKTRLFGFAFWDMLLTVIAALLVKHFLFKQVNFFFILLCLVGLGVFTHKILGINTKLNSMIFK